MKLYLVRHGETEAGTVDHVRNLTSKGRQDVKRLAQHLQQKKITVSALYHSGVLRAQQTAEILAAVLNLPQPAPIKTGLLPTDSFELIANEISVMRQDTLLVSHLPLLTTLVSELVLNNSHHALVNFTPASVVCLERFENQWIIDWMLTPAIV